MEHSAALRMKERLRADLRTAMRARLAPDVRAIRALIAALDNAEAPRIATSPNAVPGNSGPSEIQRLALDDSKVDLVIARELSELARAAAEMSQFGRQAEAASIAAEAAVVTRYLTRA